MTTTPIPAAVGTLDRATKALGAKSGDSYEDGGFQPSKTTTVTKMATSRGSIPVTLGTFEALGGAVRRRYEDGDLKGLHPCDCWYF